jgi:hypothetical protein
MVVCTGLTALVCLLDVRSVERVRVSQADAATDVLSLSVPYDLEEVKGRQGVHKKRVHGPLLLISYFSLSPLATTEGQGDQWRLREAATIKFAKIDNVVQGRVSVSDVLGSEGIYHFFHKVCFITGLLQQPLLWNFLRRAQDPHSSAGPGIRTARC